MNIILIIYMKHSKSTNVSRSRNYFKAVYNFTLLICVLYYDSMCYNLQINCN